MAFRSQAQSLREELLETASLKSAKSMAGLFLDFRLRLFATVEVPAPNSYQATSVRLEFLEKSGMLT